jgi:hypothetical protein
MRASIRGLSDALLGPTEILIEGDTIIEVSSSVGRPAGATIYDLRDRTVSPASSIPMFTFAC